MSKTVKSGLMAAAFVVVSAASAAAQATSATANVTATAIVGARARLDVTGTVAFADSDPDTVTSIDAAPLNITVRTRNSPSQLVTLTVAANGDFLNAANATIPISNLTWTAGGAGYVPGTASTTAQTVGSWSGPGNRSGTQTYRLANSWAYASGTYTVTLTYTLSAQ